MYYGWHTWRRRHLDDFWWVGSTNLTFLNLVLDFSSEFRSRRLFLRISLSTSSRQQISRLHYMSRTTAHAYCSSFSFSHLKFSNISKAGASFYIRGSKHRETDKSTRWEAFHCFVLFWNLWWRRSSFSLSFYNFSRKKMLSWKENKLALYLIGIELNFCSCVLFVFSLCMNLMSNAKTVENQVWFGYLVVFICVFIGYQYSCTWQS